METQNTMPNSLYYSSGTPTQIYWNTPERIEVIELPESIEMIYRQTSMNYVDIHGTIEVKVFKIIFSCIDGKWNKSEPIYGRVIPAQGEQIVFEENTQILQ